MALSCAGGFTCREGELHLLIHDLQGDEVVLLVEAAIIQQQGVPLLGGKPGGQGEARHTVNEPGVEGLQVACRWGNKRLPRATSPARVGKSVSALSKDSGPQDSFIHIRSGQPIKPD